MNSTQIFGFHAAQAALDYSQEKIKRGWFDAQRQDKRLTDLVDALRCAGIKLDKTDKKKLDQWSEGKNHQGIVLEVILPSVLNENDLKQSVSQLQEPAFYLVLDQIQDPHNLGACLRTADAVGVHGVILPKDNSVSMTPTVCKVASGAAETVPVYQVTNLARTLRWLKSQNIWLMGTSDQAGDSIFATDLNLPIAVILGTEGTGMRRLTQEQCDFLVNLPMQGQVESLNVSVATGVVLYEVLRQRLGLG